MLFSDLQSVKMGEKYLLFREIKHKSLDSQGGNQFNECRSWYAKFIETRVATYDKGVRGRTGVGGVSQRQLALAAA